MMNTSHDDHSSPADANQGYERSDTRGRSIFIGLAVSIIAIIAIIVFLNEFFVMTQEEIVMEQVASRVDPKLSEIRAVEERNISIYEWADSTTQTVRIPVERAMELMVEEAYQERLNNGR
jgi:hypothetical protein